MLNRRSFLQWLGVGLLATPRSLLRGVAASESPEAVATHVWNLMAQGEPDWLVDSFEPGALAEMRQSLMKFVDLARRDGQGKEALQFFGVQDFGQLKELDDRAFYAAVWRGAQQELVSQDLVRQVDYQAIGHIADDQGRVYVLYQLSSTNPELLVPRWPKVIVLERTGNGWAMLPLSRLEGVEQISLRQQDLAALLANLRMEVTGVIGHVMWKKQPLLVIRSTASSPPLRMEQVSVVPLGSDKELQAALRKGDTPAMLRLLNARYRISD